MEALGGGRVRCFNPNSHCQHGGTIGGTKPFSERAHALSLRTWRQALGRAQQTGGCVVRLDLEEAGPSLMQLLEADMAADKGVPVLEVRFNAHSTERTIKAQLEDDDARGDKKLRAELAPDASFKRASLAQASSETVQAALRTEIVGLQSQLHSASLAHAQKTAELEGQLRTTNLVQLSMRRKMSR